MTFTLCAASTKPILSIYILPTALPVGYLSAAFIRLYDNMLT